MSTHIFIPRGDQDVKQRWRTGDLQGLSEANIEEACRRQMSRNLKLLDVLSFYSHGLDYGPVPQGWYTIKRRLHSQDIYETLCNLPKGTVANLSPNRDDHGHPVIALQVTFPREALLPAADFKATPLPRTMTGSIAYSPPEPAGQEHIRFPFRMVEVSTLKRKYTWVIARTHRLSAFLLALAMSEVMQVPVESVSIVQQKKEDSGDAHCPYELYCTVVKAYSPSGPTVPYCPICGHAGSLDRAHMDQDSHRFGMTITMDGMALVETDAEISELPYTTFERLTPAQLGNVRLHQAAATNTDANVSTARGCMDHLRRLQYIHDDLTERRREDSTDHAKARAQIKLMYFALLRLMDEAKVETAMLIDNRKQQEAGGEPLYPAQAFRSRNHISVSKVEGYLLSYIQHSTVIFLLMAVARRHQLNRALEVDVTDSQRRLPEDNKEDTTKVEQINGARADDWRPLGNRLLVQTGDAFGVRYVPAAIAALRARPGHGHPNDVADIAAEFAAILARHQRRQQHGTGVVDAGHEEPMQEGPILQVHNLGEQAQ